MTTASTPSSRSLYRGQSRNGIGEGPGQPIRHGEQYLAADPPFDQDGELLDRVRPWLTLDSSPGDRSALGERLESWSCFADAGHLFVVRLCAAEVYDRRAAYFAHARAWPLDDHDGDPGLWLGRAEGFDPPWRDDAPRPEPAAAKPPEVDVEALRNHRRLAIALAASLYQAKVDGRSVVLALPLESFSIGEPAPRLAAFARAVLPDPLASRCRLRWYTRLPELFLRRLEADLVAVPEAVAAEALRARAEVTLLDRHGDVRTGPEPQAEAVEYARLVYELVLDEGMASTLPAFRKRVSRGRREPGLPSRRELNRLPLEFYLARAFRGSEADRGDLLERYLAPHAEEWGFDRDDWRALVSEEEWLEFPRETVRRFLARDDLSPAAEALRTVVDEAIPFGCLLPQVEEHGTRSAPSSAAELLEYAEVLKTADSESRALWFRELDRLFREDPQATTEVLARSGWWYFWRRRSGLDKQESARTALLWLRSMDRQIVTRESWRRAMDDLQGFEISAQESARIGLPRVPGFEDDQAETLASRAGNLAALAALASRDDPGEPMREAIREATMRRAHQRLGVSETLFVWLLGTGEEARPTAREWLALLDLPEDRRGALFLPEAIRNWLLDRGGLDHVPHDVLHRFERECADDSVDREGSGGRRVPSESATRLARAAAQQGLPSLADLLKPGSSETVGWERRAEKLVHELVSQGDPARTWTDLAAEVGAFRRSDLRGAHPLERFTAMLRAQGLEISEQEPAWERFLGLLSRLRFLLEDHPVEGRPLPVAELARVLFPEVSLGRFALGFLGLGASFDHLLHHRRWWVALLPSVLRERSGGGGEDHPEWVRALLVQAVGLLPPSQEKAFFEALDHYNPGGSV